MFLNELDLVNGYVYELENKRKVICIGNKLYNDKMQRANVLADINEEIITIFDRPFYLLNDAIHNSHIIYQKTDWSKVEKGTIVEYAYSDNKDEKYLGYFICYNESTNLFDICGAYNKKENKYTKPDIAKYCEIFKIK